MEPVVTKFDNNIYQIDVLMENKKGRLACYYIDSKDPILIEVGPRWAWILMVKLLVIFPACQSP